MFGTGRCGSTWVGSVIDSHPEVAYRFELFNCLAWLPEVRELREALVGGRVDDARLRQTRRLLLRARPLVSIPPFFRKSNRRNLGIAELYPLGRVVPGFGKAFEALYTPRADAPLVFKEVTHEQMMGSLLRLSDTPVVYLVRHPAGVRLSELRAQQAGKLPVRRQSILRALLADHRPQLLDRFADRIDRLSPLKQNALLWRFDVERGLDAAKAHPQQCLVLLYERICRDPHAAFQRIFDHLGLDLPEQTDVFLRHLVTKRPTERRPEDMFSVQKNPVETAYGWRAKADRDDLRLIMDIVADSEAYRLGAPEWEAADDPAPPARP